MDKVASFRIEPPMTRHTSGLIGAKIQAVRTSGLRVGALVGIGVVVRPVLSLNTAVHTEVLGGVSSALLHALMQRSIHRLLDELLAYELGGALAPKPEVVHLAIPET